ncbi:MAG: type II secretion system protein, partial [Patescibacteria group bacterium]
RLSFVKQNLGGFTLVETLVAISIFSVAIVGLMSVLASGISSTTSAKQKMIASYLAQEGIEYVRNMRDNYVLFQSNGWNSFRSELVSCNPDGGECGFDSSLLSTDPDFIFGCSTPSDCKLYVDANTGGYDNDSSGAYSGFVRKIWMEIIDQDNEVKIFSYVEWTQGSGTRRVTFSENLFNWVEQ